jgi:hypothetical protein
MGNRHPSPNSLLKLAAKLGINVRFQLGPHGQVTEVEKRGKVGESNSFPGDGAAEVNPWDLVLDDADKKRPS